MKNTLLTVTYGCNRIGLNECEEPEFRSMSDLYPGI